MQSPTRGSNVQEPEFSCRAQQPPVIITIICDDGERLERDRQLVKDITICQQSSLCNYPTWSNCR